VPPQYTASRLRFPPAKVILPHTGQVSRRIIRVSSFHSASASIIARPMIRSAALRARYAWARHTSSQYWRRGEAFLGSRAPQEKQ
jgi:hypothetical protein